MLLLFRDELFVFRLGVGRHDVVRADICLPQLRTLADISVRAENAVFHLGIVADADAVHDDRAQDACALADGALSPDNRVLERSALVDACVAADQAVVRQLCAWMNRAVVAFGCLERHNTAAEHGRQGERRR